jgi:predicted acetyltransferase
VEENNVALTLVVDGGELHVLPADTSVPGAVLDIGTFTQLLFGAYSAARLQDTGLLEAADERVVRALDALFPPCVNYINEDY